MSKETNKLIPDLRFPEFVNEGEWEKITLGRILQFQTGFPFDSQGFNEAGKGIRLIKNRDLKSDDKIVFYSKSFDEKFIVENGDVLIGMDGDFTPCVWQKGEALLNQRVGRILANIKDQERFFYYFLSIHLKTIEERTAKTTVKHLSHSDVEKIHEHLPKPNEQQKIASCLSSLDEVIAAHSQKLEMLKEHKKGLMQNLFPQKGEKVPKLRFKEFVKGGEWFQTTVEDNCLVKGRIGYRGYTTQDLVGQNEGALVLGGKHIQNQMLELKDPTYLSWEKYYESPEIMVEVGDIIFSQRGTLGDCAIIDRKIGPATINPSMVLLKNITCDARFLYYILIGDRIQAEVKKNMAMGAIPMLSQKQIREFPFLISKNPKEQQKIASCLSSLDALVAAQAEKIEQLKLHKKGLMQGLFPNIKD